MDRIHNVYDCSRSIQLRVIGPDSAIVRRIEMIIYPPDSYKLITHNVVEHDEFNIFYQRGTYRAGNTHEFIFEDI